MLVLGFCPYRKAGKHRKLVEGFLEGFSKLGYKTKFIELKQKKLSVSFMDSYKKLNPLFTVSAGWKSNIIEFKKYLDSKHLAIFDPPIRPTVFHRTVNDNYWGICFNRPHGAYRYDMNLLPNRWDELKQYYKIKVKPWIDGKDIVIAHQPNVGFNRENRYPFYDTVIKKCIKTGRKVIICTSPKNDGSVLDESYKKKWINMGCEFKVGIHGNLNDAYCFISSGGTTASKAIFEGVPIFGGELNITNPLFPIDNNIDKFLKNPPKPNREPWFNWIAYQQWTLDEMKSGEALKYFLSVMNK